MKKKPPIFVPRPPALKRCPFCGEVPTMHKNSLKPETIHQSGWVLTHRCEIVGGMAIFRESAEEIARTWNTRTNGQAQARRAKP